MSEEAERGYQALYTVNQMINTLDLDNRETYAKWAWFAVESNNYGLHMDIYYC